MGALGLLLPIVLWALGSYRVPYIYKRTDTFPDGHLSGQIPLDPGTMELVSGDIEAQTRRVFDNLAAVMHSAGGSFGNIVKLTIYLVDLEQFARVNTVMAEYFEPPFPSRATVAVAALPKGAAIEVEAVAHLSD